MDEGARIDAMIIDFSKAFDLVQYDRLLIKISASGVNYRVVVWVRELFLGLSQTVRVGGQTSEEISVISEVPQGSVLGPLLFFAYVTHIWRNLESSFTNFPRPLCNI